MSKTLESSESIFWDTFCFDVPDLYVMGRGARLKSKCRKSVDLEMDRPGFGGQKPRGEGLAAKETGPRG